MTIIYFDECKSDPAQGRHWYIVAGLLVDLANLVTVENIVSDIAYDVFKTRELVPATEFHGKDIFNGKAAFKGKAIDDRLDILDRLLAVIADDTLLSRVFAAVKTDNLKLPTEAPRFAFAHFVERAQMSLPAGGNGVLIGDMDDQQARQMVSDFSRYRQHGTPWKYGKSVTQIAGSVNFVRSHHSRLMQLTDVYVYAVTNGYAPRGGYAGKRLTEIIRARNPYPHRYKHWEPA